MKQTHCKLESLFFLPKTVSLVPLPKYAGVFEHRVSRQYHKLLPYKTISTLLCIDNNVCQRQYLHCLLHLHLLTQNSQSCPFTKDSRTRSKAQHAGSLIKLLCYTAEPLLNLYTVLFIVLQSFPSLFSQMTHFIFSIMLHQMINS